MGSELLNPPLLEGLLAARCGGVADDGLRGARAGAIVAPSKFSDLLPVSVAPVSSWAFRVTSPVRVTAAPQAAQNRLVEDKGAPQESQNIAVEILALPALALRA
jgi:hypothetical protein